MTLQADKGKCRRWQCLEINERVIAASGLDALLTVFIYFFGSKALDRDTSGAVTGLTIDKGHPGGA